MFGGKPNTEPESDSDWDSIPGDVAADEPSSQEPTPRYNPAPPPAATAAGSPRRNPVKPQTAVPDKTPSGSLAAKDVRPGTAPSPHRPSQMYGKSPGVTTFTDRSAGITTFADKSQLTPDINANRGSSSSSRGQEKRGTSQINLEMNDIDSQPNPPFTDFRDSLEDQDVSRPTRNDQRKQRTKSPYTHVTKTPVPPEDSDNNSWDESIRENPVSDSRQQLTETPRSQKQKKTKPQKQHESAAPQTGAVQHNCCVPLEAERQEDEYSYYFHHGHNDHLTSNPVWREPQMKIIADRSEKWLQYFWLEFFSVLRILLDFAFIFVLELFRFVLRYIVLRVLAGVVMVLGDHLLKPALTVLFNSFVQPVFIFAWNFLTGLRNVLRPVLDVFREVVQHCATLLRAFRLFELTWKPSQPNQLDRTRDVREV